MYSGTVDWSALIEEMCGDVPADFLARWIHWESGGNPCSKGMWGGPWEAGIGQVYFGVKERNKRNFGATLDELRECCYVGSQKMATAPTDNQKRVNVLSLVAMASEYIGIAKRKTAALGLAWPESDILCLAKLYHALPVLCTTHLSVAATDGAADSWDAYRAYASGLSRDDVLAWDQVAGYPPGKGAARFYPLDRLFDNAEKTGRG